MKKLIIVTLMFVLALSFTSYAGTSATMQEATVVEIIPESEITPDYGIRYAKKYINLHELPSNEANIIATIARGSEVRVLGREEGFTKIVWNDLEGYIGNNLLATKEDYDDFINNIPYCEEIPLSQDIQRYFYLECYDSGLDYALALSIVDRETGGSFNPNSISPSLDFGLFQCNQCWRSTFKKLGFIQNDMTDLLNPYNSIHAGVYLLSQYYAEYGVSEAAAFKYNRGHASKNSSNDYSRDVIYNRYPKWKAILEQ